MGEKTEEPTPKRLREAREKGDICKSQDVAPAATVMAITGYFMASGPEIYKQALEMMTLPMQFMHLPFGEALPLISGGIVSFAFMIAGPVVGLAMLVGFAATIVQTGVLIAPQAAMPKMENLSPKKWFQKVFAVKNLVEFLKNCIKVGVLGYVAWDVVNAQMQALFSIANGTIDGMAAILGNASKELLLKAAGAFCVIAALDFLYQKYKYGEDHKMDKDEVKREHKESEGDPQIKGQRKQLHNELASGGGGDGAKLKKAKALVTNPTHYAIAIDYEKGITPLPIVLMKGKGPLALAMIDFAKEEGIPIMRNVPLARSLYAKADEDAYIPSEFIAPVAEVLRWVQSLDLEAIRQGDEKAREALFIDNTP